MRCPRSSPPEAPPQRRGRRGTLRPANSLRSLFGHYCPIIAPVNGKEFIERVTALGYRRGVQVRVDAKRGKGSHVMLYHGDRKTVVKDRRKDIGPGLLAAMTRQLELEPGDRR